MPDVDAAGQDYWDAAWDGFVPEKYPGPIHSGHDIYSRILPKRAGDRFLEIGCVPGNWMVYFAREYGYQPYGLDYSNEIALARKTLDINRLSGELVKADVFEWTPAEEFDVVFSSGFVEHFDDYVAPVRRHVEFTRPGGHVVIAIPNVRYFNRLTMKRLSPEAYAVHRFELMQPGVLRDVCEQLGVKTLFYGFENRTIHSVTPLGRFDLLYRALGKALRITRLNRLPNRWFSPYIIYVGRKQ